LGDFGNLHTVGIIMIKDMFKSQISKISNLAKTFSKLLVI
jgi:hypothetical protein